MEPAARPRGVTPRLVWIVLPLALLGALAIVAVVALGSFSVLRMMDRTDAHICGLAFVRRSSSAARLVGRPIEQHGFTGGSSSSENGELNQRMTFTVTGPRGSAFVVSEGRRSPLASHLVVRIGRDQRGETIYSGPFDCPELH
jgi:hypothetical protein